MSDLANLANLRDALREDRGDGRLNTHRVLDALDVLCGAVLGDQNDDGDQAAEPATEKPKGGNRR